MKNVRRILTVPPNNFFSDSNFTFVIFDEESFFTNTNMQEVIKLIERNSARIEPQTLIKNMKLYNLGIKMF